MNDYDRSIAVGELKTLPTATIQPGALQDMSILLVPTRPLYFSYRTNQGRFQKKLRRKSLIPEDLWRERELQEYMPIQVTTEDDMEWWWFEDEFFQTRFVKGCPSQC